MDEAALRSLLEEVRTGARSPDDAVVELRRLPFTDLGYARVDHHRALRTGRPEAVYAPGKSPAQCAGIVAELLGAGAAHEAGTAAGEPPNGAAAKQTAHEAPGAAARQAAHQAPGAAAGETPHEAPGGPVVLSRADGAQVAAALAACPGGTVTAGPGGATVVWRPAPSRTESVLVVTAGTADLPVADECVAVLGAYGLQARLVADVGVAGLHRLLAEVDAIQAARAVVVVAGMEGALASVVGGLTAAPVVAVPTSAGYGSSLEGVTALLGMLASCASGLVVVGVDNGFGAAHAVARFLPRPAGEPEDGAISQQRRRDEEPG